MKLDKFFELTKEEGLSASELSVSKTKSLRFELFHSEISNYTIEEKSSGIARGILSNKFGVVSTNQLDKKSLELIAKELKNNASIIDKEEDAIIYKGSPKYKKGNVYNSAISALSIDQKLKNMRDIEEKLKNSDLRITEVEGVYYVESEEENILENSYGLKLKAKANYFYYYASVVAKENEEIKNGAYLFISNKPEEFDIDSFCHRVTKEAISKLGSKPIVSGKYPCILNPEVTASLVEIFANSASAEEVQKHSSLLEGKLNEQVISKKVTILENPLTKNCFFRYFDSEGVATQNKKIFDKGVLKTYLYNLETAKKDGVESTGNGYGSTKIGIGTTNIVLKPGRKTEEELIATIKEGVYITSLSGMNAGINAQSGNFSLESQGFMIRDGKIAEPISLFTTAGNLLELFKNVKEVASNSELQSSSTSAPSILVKKLAFAG